MAAATALPGTAIAQRLRNREAITQPLDVETQLLINRMYKQRKRHLAAQRAAREVGHRRMEELRKVAADKRNPDEAAKAAERLAALEAKEEKRKAARAPAAHNPKAALSKLPRGQKRVVLKRHEYHALLHKAERAERHKHNAQERVERAVKKEREQRKEAVKREKAKHKEDRPKKPRKAAAAAAAGGGGGKAKRAAVAAKDEQGDSSEDLDALLLVASPVDADADADADGNNHTSATDEDEAEVNVEEEVKLIHVKPAKPAAAARGAKKPAAPAAAALNKKAGGGGVAAAAAKPASLAAGKKRKAVHVGAV